ncbi:MAG TPA: hypothetical protein VFC74_06310 [Oscillospiraceae bacterium]|nr:hypothetical protein [Oscillospiraceae bacterium]
MFTEQEEQILTYVMGLLHYYGAAYCSDLYERVEEQLQVGWSKEDFHRLLERTVLNDNHPYVMELEDEICFDFEVDDSEWVLAQQQQQAALDFRPVNEREAACLLEDRHLLLWSDSEEAFYAWLEARCDDSDLALTVFLEYASLLKNGLTPLALAQKLVQQLAVMQTEIQEVAELVLKFAAATPMWTLKGWRPNELPLSSLVK